MPTALTNLTIREVSLVDRPANSEVDPVTGVKVPRARVALFKRDSDKTDFGKDVADPNAGKVINKQGETQMTLEEITKKVDDQEKVLKSITEENNVLKTENALVIKMSKKERKAYAAMPEEKRKEYVAADDEKRKNMMGAACKAVKEKAAEDSMDEALKKRYVEAGPVEKQAILEMVAKKGKKAPPKDDEEPDGDEGAAGGDDEEPTLKVDLAKALDRVGKAEQTLVQMQKSQRLADFTKRAEAELPHTAGTPIEKGELLMTMADALPGGESGEAFKKYLGTLKAADAQIGKSFTEIGKHGGGEGLSSLVAFDKCVEDIAKRDKITVAKATEKAMMEQPQLYMEYEKDQRQLALRR